MSLQIQLEAKNNFSVNVYAGRAKGSFNGVTKKKGSKKNKHNSKKCRHNSTKFMQHSTKCGQNFKKRKLTLNIKLPHDFDPNNLLQEVKFRTKITGSKWSQHSLLDALLPANICNVEESDVIIPWNSKHITNNYAGSEMYMNNKDLNLHTSTCRVVKNRRQRKHNQIKNTKPKVVNKGKIKKKKSKKLKNINQNHKLDVHNIISPKKTSEELKQKNFKTGPNHRIIDLYENDLLPSNDMNFMINNHNAHKMLQCLEDDYLDHLASTQGCAVYPKVPLEALVFRGMCLIGDRHMYQLAFDIANNLYKGKNVSWEYCSSENVINDLILKLSRTSCIGHTCCIMVGSNDIIQKAFGIEPLEDSVIEIVESYCRLVIELKKNFNKIIWLNLIPIPRYENCYDIRVKFRYLDLIQEVNKFINTFNENGRIMVLDVNMCFSNFRGRALADYFYRTIGEGKNERLDGVHLNEKGKKHLQNFIEERVSYYIY
uniref:OSK domain-containing protein n=2 Tax=Clastoptera arizonana TaxID=38151 RepID=A0A1B6D2R9_9HEMI